MQTDTSDQLEERRRINYEVAEAVAPTWESRRAEIEALAAPVREWLLRALAPAPGDTVLELAAGVGDTGFEAASLVGESGRVISSDFSPTMVEAARRRGAELGLRNVDYRVLDAERIELADGSVDGAICRFGYMLMPDAAAALAETRRVLRPGGRLALAVWGAPERNPFFTTIAAQLVARGHIPPPEPEGPGIFSLADPERARELLARAGFTDVRTEEVPVTFAVADIDEYLRFVADTAGAIAIAVRGLPDGERRSIAAELEPACAAFATARGYEFPGVALVALAA